MNSTFINLKTDFGFKRLFGSEQFKGIALRFLNALFGDEFHIEDVRFLNKEILPSDIEGKSIVYDVYCTHIKPNLRRDDFDELDDRPRGEHFIIEMQNSYSYGSWERRALFYTATSIVDQVRQGKIYDYNPVFSVFVTDFNMKGMSKKLIHDVRPMDIETKEIYSNEVRMIFLSLKEVSKNWKDCKTELERILFLIKNMDKMNKESEAYKSRKYEDMFDASEVMSLAAEDVQAYSSSYLKMEDEKRAVAYARSEGEALGRAEGEARGRAEGEARGIALMIRNMAEQGFGSDVIAKIAKMTEAQVKQILNLTY